MVIGVNNEDEGLGVVVVMSPHCPEIVLTSDVPTGDGDVLALGDLDVEANARGDGIDLAF